MIVAAAIRVNGNIYIAKRHDILFKLFGSLMKCHPAEQGFVDEHGYFYDRQAAAKAAAYAGQTYEDTITLMSEDLIAQDPEYSRRFE